MASSTRERCSCPSELFETEPPAFNRRYLESRLAYRIQELAYGGLKPETVRRLAAFGSRIRQGHRQRGGGDRANAREGLQSSCHLAGFGFPADVPGKQVDLFPGLHELIRLQSPLWLSARASATRRNVEREKPQISLPGEYRIFSLNLDRFIVRLLA